MGWPLLGPSLLNLSFRVCLPFRASLLFISPFIFNEVKVARHQRLILAQRTLLPLYSLTSVPAAPGDYLPLPSAHRWDVLVVPMVQHSGALRAQSVIRGLGPMAH